MRIEDVQNRQEAPTPDSDLVARSLGAREAFDELVRRHYGLVYSVAYARVGQREAAEEIAQETFLRAYLHLESLKEPVAFAAWLLRITRNLAESWRVQGKTRSRLVQMVPIDDIVAAVPDDRQPSARETVAARHDARVVREALEKLPVPDRELVTLHFLEGVSKSDLARRLGVYPSTVGRQLDSALAFLRKELGSTVSAVPGVLQPSSGAVIRAGLLMAAVHALAPSARAKLLSAASATLTSAGAASAGASSAGSASGAGAGAGAGAGSAGCSPTVGSKLLPFTSPSGAKIMIGSTLAAITLGLTLLLRPTAVAPQPQPSPAVVEIEPRFPEHRRPLAAAAAPATFESAAAPAVAEQPQPMEILATREAEKARLTGQNSPRSVGDSWASGAAHVEFWGEAGDTAEWEAEFASSPTDLQLAVRYAYHAEEYRNRVPDSAETHVVHFSIDGQGPTPLSLEDTGGWNWFKVATVPIPPIAPGRHVFRIVSPSSVNAANLDCFTIFRGTLDPIPATPLRPSVVHEAEGGNFTVLASPLAVLPASPETIAKTFEQLRALMVDDFGRTPQPNILVHFADQKHWDSSHGRAVVNRFGIYLLADGTLNRADWCWALAEYFGEPRLPRWFRDSSARVGGLLDWLPAIDESTTESEELDAADLISEARRILADENARTTRLEVIHAAVRARHGADVFRKFWHLLRTEEGAEGAEGTADAPQALDKLAVMELLSQAAGSDVTPLYRRWTGFADEGPVDPLVVRDVETRM